MIRLAILGSTGSIGRQTLDVVRAHPDMFVVESLTASSSWELLSQQAKEFEPNEVVIANEAHYTALRSSLRGTPTLVKSGVDAIDDVAQSPNADTVVVAIVGFAGLSPTVTAIKARKKVALANKESLVVGGELIMRLCAQNGVRLMPIDSEHSAIFQCLVGEESPLNRILLTASGGSLRDVPLDKLGDVSVEQVLCHPVWDMGARITVDSATMLNKGFEIIEAAHLFNASAEQIQVVIHPESIIHSAVEFGDGAIKAQLSYPDMRLAIQYALTYPVRHKLACLQRFDPFTTKQLTFDKPDPERYPCLELAYEALRAGGIRPAILNAAGEVAVDAFLGGQIGFTDIARIISSTLNAMDNEKLTSINQLYECDATARAITTSLL